MNWHTSYIHAFEAQRINEAMKTVQWLWMVVDGRVRWFMQFRQIHYVWRDGNYWYLVDVDSDVWELFGPQSPWPPWIARL